MKGLKIFRHEFLYIAYEDDITFFLKENKYVLELMTEFNTFQIFSRLKTTKTKWEISGIGVMNGVQVALCGMKCVNLNNEIVKTFDSQF